MAGRSQDWNLKQQLLRAIECDHTARYGWTNGDAGKRLMKLMDDLLADLHALHGTFRPS